MNKFPLAAIALAIAPVSLAAAEPAKSESQNQNQDAAPQANCPYMQDGQTMPMHGSDGTAGMQHHMGAGAQAGQGQVMNHGDHHAMGDRAQHGHMQGQAMPHGDQAAMPGQHHAMMQGEARCPVAPSQNEDDGK